MDKFDAVIFMPGRIRSDRVCISIVIAFSQVNQRHFAFKKAKLFADKERSPHQRYIFKTLESPRKEHKSLINQKYFSRYSHHLC